MALFININTNIKYMGEQMRKIYMAYICRLISPQQFSFWETFKQLTLKVYKFSPEPVC